MSNPSGDSVYHATPMDDVYRATTTSIPNASASRNVLDTLKTAFVGGAGSEDPEEKEAFLELGPLSSRYAMYSIFFLDVTGRIWWKLVNTTSRSF